MNDNIDVKKRNEIIELLDKYKTGKNFDFSKFNNNTLYSNAVRDKNKKIKSYY